MHGVRRLMLLFTVYSDHSRQLRLNSDELQEKKDRLVELQTTCKMKQYVLYYTLVQYT